MATQADIVALRKRRQLYQIVCRHGLYFVSGFSPRRQAADNHKRVESLLPQEERHTGARALAQSSAIDINVFILGKIFNFHGQVIGLNANGTLNARSIGVVITVAADVSKNDFIFLFGVQLQR